MTAADYSVAAAQMARATVDEGEHHCFAVAL
jgi:hypothetical protein